MGTAMRALADRLDAWRYELRPDRIAKEEVLAGLIQR